MKRPVAAPERPRERRAWLLALALCGCAVAPGSERPLLAPSVPLAGAPTQLVTRETADHPSISLIARAGDPSGAIAVAVAHDLGSQASALLAALVAARLERRGFTAESAPTALGHSVRVLARAPAAAESTVLALTSALLDSVSPTEDLAPLTRAATELRGKSYAGPGEAATAACSGELGIPAGVAVIDVTTPAGRTLLEAWRSRAHGAAGVAFGAVGAPELLDAAAAALAATPRWPAASTPVDTWPERDQLGVDSDDTRPRRAAFALRLGSPAAAFAAAHTLSAVASPLAERLAALEPAWSVERVLSSVRPRGACLRLDLRPTGVGPPDRTSIAAALLVAEEEAERAAHTDRPDARALDAAALRPSDPRAAAAAAAWRLLASRLPAGPTRKSVSWRARRAETGPGSGAAIEQALGALRGRGSRIETRLRSEPGQGETWMLLASPCGALGETSHDAGATALALYALGGRDRSGEVAIEPWISGEGAGLLVHGTRGDEEPVEAHAERVADALGRALAGQRASGERVAAALPELLETLGGGVAPARAAMLEALVSGHPSLLEPRGTWQSLSSLQPDAAEARRRVLLAGPLRLAVLTPGDQKLEALARAAVERWLLPAPLGSAACPVDVVPAPTPGERRLDDVAEGPAAIVGVRLDPAELRATPDAAQHTALLLARAGGWLESALGRPGLASARVRLLGGAQARALLVELEASAENLEPAVAQTRALFDRLARGAATTADVETARAEAERLETEALLDPRRRIVDLWRGARDLAPPDLESLHRMQRQLAADKHVVIIAARR